VSSLSPAEQTTAVRPRHAKLAVSASAALPMFLYETHVEIGP
jgi:hypothetical protein